MASLVEFLDASGFKYAPGTQLQVPRPVQRTGQKWIALPKSLVSPLIIVAAPRSGSTLLFETLARSERLCSVGGEAHWLVENHPALRPGAPGVDSNRLTADQATDSYRDSIIDQILARLVDRDGNPVSPDEDRLLLEKTPKNALRIPFFECIFPDARFVLLWRDPRENISSIMEAWRSGRFRTYKQVADFQGPWSMLLPPGYRAFSNRPLEEIAAFQWECTNRTILEDLKAFPADRWLPVRYADLIIDPARTVQRVLDFAHIAVDSQLTRHLLQPLPPSRYTQTAPAAEKWRMNAAQIERVLPTVERTWRRLQGMSS